MDTAGITDVCGAGGFRSEYLGIENPGPLIHIILVYIARIGQALEMGQQVIGNISPHLGAQFRYSGFVLTVSGQAEFLFTLIIKSGIHSMQHAIIGTEIGHVPTVHPAGHKFSIRGVSIQQMQAFHRSSNCGGG